MKKQEQGSYTLEAAWIMSIVLSVLCAGILLGYHIFHQELSYIREPAEELDAADLFRQRELLEQGKKLLEEIK